MAFKYEVRTYGDSKFYDNRVTFATHDEADKAGRDKLQAWLMVEEYRVVESDETPNYRWVDGTGLVEIPPTPMPEHIKDRLRYVEVTS